MEAIWRGLKQAVFGRAAVGINLSKAFGVF
jgi:hypothetical protein